MGQPNAPRRAGALRPRFLLRWLARAWSVASVLLLIGFFVGERWSPSRLAPRDWLGFLCFPLGVTAGMLIAWRRAGLGGAITVTGLLAFYGVHLATTGRFPPGWAWLAFAAPGILFLGSWWAERPSRSRPPGR